MEYNQNIVRLTTNTANLRDLLFAAPAGARPTMGLDPGLRSGVKVTTADRTCVASLP
jgi:transcriptional accessory protein Tex/SPT6